MKNALLNYVAAFPGKYIQGEQALAGLPELSSQLAERALLFASPTIVGKVLPQHLSTEDLSRFHVETFRGECCQQEIERLLAVVRQKRIGLLVGMGGGKSLDTAKIVADRADIPVIIVPTIASTDAPCSGCAVIYTSEGAFESIYYQKSNPQIVLVDTGIIASAPVRFLVAGMGDALATRFEAESCERTFSVNECGGHSTLAGMRLARLCFETIMRYGRTAKLANENKIITPALERVIEANILLSGIGFESSGLATAHSVHNGLTALEETHALYHGEKVAFGVLTGLHLNDASPEEMEVIYNFCEDIGLPTTFDDLGISNVSRDRLMKVAQKACAPQEGIHHEAICITPEKVLAAMLAADALGRARKQGGLRIMEPNIYI